jgi:hypothetical protein
MLETGNPPRRGGTEHRGAGAKNTGIMKYWVMEEWYSGLLVKFILKGKYNTFINEELPLKINIPIFQLSIIPCVRQKEYASINYLHLNGL